MLLNASNVELTKVHYFETSKRHRNTEISTISREMFDNKVNGNPIIRHNIFGHRWVLKVNENSSVKSTNKWKIFVYVLVSCCILVAVAFGIYISLIESLFYKNEVNETKNTNRTLLETDVPKKTINSTNVTKGSILVDELLRKLITYEKLDLRNTEPTKNQSVEGKPRDTNRNNDISKHKIKKKKTSICNCTKDDEICLKLHPLRPPRCVESVDRRDPSGCGGLCRINVQYCKLLDKERSVYECINNTNILRCPERHFNCGDMCVSEQKRCDGFRHCKDNSDEINCECDLNTNFHCGNQTSCLDLIKKCDGIVDCWDNYDELDCNRSCVKGQVPCLTNSECILSAQICDGIVDCTDQSDEPFGCGR